MEKKKYLKGIGIFKQIIISTMFWKQKFLFRVRFCSPVGFSAAEPQRGGSLSTYLNASMTASPHDSELLYSPPLHLHSSSTLFIIVCIPNLNPRCFQSLTWCEIVHPAAAMEKFPALPPSGYRVAEKSLFWEHLKFRPKCLDWCYPASVSHSKQGVLPWNSEVW